MLPKFLKAIPNLFELDLRNNLLPFQGRRLEGKEEIARFVEELRQWHGRKGKDR